MTRGIPHKPTKANRKLVEELAGFGLTTDQIAKATGTALKTLHKYYRDELDKGHLIANAAVARSLFRKAVGNDRGAVTACIFWLKTRAGWKETMHLQTEGEAPTIIKIVAADSDEPQEEGGVEEEEAPRRHKGR